MKLTDRTDFGLRVLVLLALEPDSVHTIDEISERYRVSRHHMTKVCALLVKAGFVESVRGRCGGLRLKMPAERINLGSVVRKLERTAALTECFDNASNACVLASACGLRGPLQRALSAFFAELDASTLADLATQQPYARQMRRLLRS